MEGMKNLILIFSLLITFQSMSQEQSDKKIVVTGKIIETRGACHASTKKDGSKIWRMPMVFKLVLDSASSKELEVYTFTLDGLPNKKLITDKDSNYELTLSSRTIEEIEKYKAKQTTEIFLDFSSIRLIQ